MTERLRRGSAELERSFRAAGAVGPGFDSIVGGGENSCVLHYVTNDRQMQDVFAVQDEIAQSIAGALQVTLAPQATASAEDHVWMDWDEMHAGASND